jgi:hypothetical protein
MKFESCVAGSWQTRNQYRSFEPTPVNQSWTWEDAGISVLLEEANRAIGELNAFSLIVPDVDLFIQMHVVKEAQTSSRIEGTRTEMDEALLSEEQIAPDSTPLPQRRRLAGARGRLPPPSTANCLRRPACACPDGSRRRSS